MESAARGGAEMSGEAINKLGRYSYSNIKKNRTTEKGPQQNQYRKPITCYNCGNSVSGSIIRHKEQCPAKSSKCNKCGKYGHFAKVCKSGKELRSLKDQDEESKCKEQSDEEEALMNMVTKSSTKRQVCQGSRWFDVYDQESKTRLSFTWSI